MLNDLESDLTTWQTFQRLWTIIAPFKLGLAGAAIALVLNAGIDIVLLGLIKPLLDQGFGQADFNLLRGLPLAILLLMIVRGVTQFSAEYGLAWVSGHVVMTLRQRLFDHFLHLPVSFFDQHSSATLLSRITYDSEQVANSSSEALAALVREGAYIIGLLGMMFYFSWQLSSILLVVAPLVSLVISQVSKHFRAISKCIQSAMGSVTDRVDQVLKGHKEVLIFGGQSAELQRFFVVSNQMRQQKMRMVIATAFADPLTQIIASSALVFVLYVATMPGVMHTITAGTFTVIFSSMLSLMRPVKSMATVNSRFQSGMAACQTLFALLDLPVAQDCGQQQLSKRGEEIAFCNVTFTYPGKTLPTLNNVTLRIPAGQTVALVGRSGAGKSTIASLLSRFYEVDQGTIQLHGRDIRDYSLATLRQQIALVSQHVYLFNDTIINNIAYACEGSYTREQIEQAAEQAHVTDFSSTLAQGLETLVGENGVLLSGGQRQRIAIARALLRDRPILILDEATSALDNDSEQVIQKALRQLQRNRTSFVIAHRLSTIEKADQIIVIEAGSIIEQGTHQALLACQGLYAQWYRKQMGLMAVENRDR